MHQRHAVDVAVVHVGASTLAVAVDQVIRTGADVEKPSTKVRQHGSYPLFREHRPPEIRQPLLVEENESKWNADEVPERLCESSSSRVGPVRVSAA